MEANVDLDEDSVGFLDESSVVSMPNKRRVLNTKAVKYTQTTSGKKSRRSKSLFGFMFLNGEDVVMMADKGNSQSLIESLKIVRKTNKNKRIILICDNAKIHHARITKAFLDDENIVFVHLPPYSPDLNPIEFGWKDVKKGLSRYLIFDEMIEKAETFAFEKISSNKQGYTKAWINKFMMKDNKEKLVD